MTVRQIANSGTIEILRVYLSSSATTILVELGIHFWDEGSAPSLRHESLLSSGQRFLAIVLRDSTSLFVTLFYLEISLSQSRKS